MIVESITSPFFAFGRARCLFHSWKSNLVWWSPPQQQTRFTPHAHCLQQLPSHLLQQPRLSLMLLSCTRILILVTQNMMEVYPFMLLPMAILFPVYIYNGYSSTTTSHSLYNIDQSLFCYPTGLAKIQWVHLFWGCHWQNISCWHVTVMVLTIVDM